MKNALPRQRHRRFIGIPLAVMISWVGWVLVLGGLLWWGVRDQNSAIRELATIEARASFNKDLLYRRWSAGHGGTYVPATRDTPPNPYLSHVEERDISTPSGRQLTLVNPAYMTRQVHELGKEQYGAKGHITSLNPLRPENRPDQWEADALRAFEAGAEEITAVVSVDGRDNLRFMRPLITERRCLKCHAEQGYKVGQIRGGISVSVPLDKYRTVAGENIRDLLFDYLIIFAIGTAAIVIGGLLLIQKNRERNDALAALETERDLLERVMQTSPAGIMRIDANGQIVYANPCAEQILGLRLTDAIPRSYNDPAWHITDFEGNPVPEEVMPFSRVRRTGKPVTGIHHAIRRPDGRLVRLSINAAPLLNAAGAFDGTVTSIEDITEKVEAEKNYEMLFREMIDAFALHEIICDEKNRPVDYRFLTVNPAFERHTGLTEAALTGRTVREVFPDIDPDWIDRYGRVALTGDPVSFESYFPALKKHFQVTAFRPAPMQFACIFTDISDRKQAYADREKLQMQLANAVEIAQLGHWEYDMIRDRFTFNDQFYRIFRTSADKVGGYTMNAAEYAKRFVHPDDRFLVEREIRRARETDDPDFKGHLEHRIIYDDDRIGYISVLFFIVKDAAGTTVKTYGVNQDITERRKMQERLQEAQKMEAIGTLAGGIAHDFNNILFPIVGMAEMLLDDLPAGSPEYNSAREIFHAGRRGSELVKQILAFSRRTERRMIPVKVESVLKEALRLARSSIPADIAIDVDIRSGIGFVNADATQLHQVIMNLITNAFHAVEQTGGRISVSLVKTEAVRDTAIPQVTGEVAGHARLTVSDTGCGIPKTVVDKIFEPYFTTKATGKGTGLGLAVVYGIVKEHGGQIEVFSREGHGTTFHVHLPLIDTTAAIPSAAPNGVLSTGDERILLVDDEPAISRLEEQMLRRLGYRVTSYTDSREALAAFRAAPDQFDLVVTDMTMPHMTGDRLAMSLTTVRPDIPVIICTGFSEKIDLDSARAMGIKGFLMKPIEKQALAETIRDVLDGVRNTSPR